MSAPAVFSNTLQILTKSKAAELSRIIHAHEKWLHELLSSVDNARDDNVARVRTIVNALGTHPSGSPEQNFIDKASMLLNMAEYDPTVDKTALQTIETGFRKTASQRIERFKIAQLYSELLNDWLSQVDSSPRDGVYASTEESSTMSGAYEVLEKDRLQQLRDKFANAVFTPLNTDEGAIEAYLTGIFDDEEGREVLSDIREEMHNFGTSFFYEAAPFKSTTLTTVIKSILSSILLTEEKKTVLRSFLNDAEALNEIENVLNMRWMDLRNWSWDAGEQGLPVQPRRQLNGKYRIMVEEDIIQAIFLHYIGLMWSVKLREILHPAFRGTTWKPSHATTAEQDQTRKYYTGQEGETWLNSESLRRRTFMDNFLLAPLPNSLEDGFGDYDNNTSDTNSEAWDNTDQDKKVDVHQMLLREMATDVLIAQETQGQVAVVQSDLQWFGTSLPHSTIFAILRFLQVPSEWIDFFRKFLEAPLNVYLDDAPRTRRRGVSMAHSLALFFGEMVLSFMDLAVNREDCMLLYRLHDDLLVWGEPSKVAAAWRTMEHYTTLMGLEFNMRKTGSVYIVKDEKKKDADIQKLLPQGKVTFGFIELRDNGEWEVDLDKVDAHATQLLKQLGACKSVLEWTQTWNSCIGRFFIRSFGEPANIFGRKHVSSILSTHAHIQNILFGPNGLHGQTYTQHLKHLISTKHNITPSSIPDGFLFAPESKGGLGIRNPFLPFLLVRDNLVSDPAALVRAFISEEIAEYNKAKAQFFEKSLGQRRHDLDELFPYHAERPDPEQFMSFEEWKLHWETSSTKLSELKKQLKLQPRMKPCGGRNSCEFGGKPQNEMVMRWTEMQYCDELTERFGGVEIAEPRFLPLVALKMLKDVKVPWQMEL